MSEPRALDRSAGLAPGLLVASPPLGDPNFDRAVVLLAMHGDGGALGFVINRLSPVSLGELLSLGGYGDAVEGDATPVLIGGPVQPGSGWIVSERGFDPEAGAATVDPDAAAFAQDPDEAALDLGDDEGPESDREEDDGESVIWLPDGVRVSSSRKAFDALAKQARSERSDRSDRSDESARSSPSASAPRGAARRLVLLGYSGWGPGQLEREIASGAWLPVPFDEGVVFDPELDKKWERAYALVGLTPSSVMSMNRVGEA